MKVQVELSEAQARYIMSKVEPDVVAGMGIADQIERILDTAIMATEEWQARFAHNLERAREWEMTERPWGRLPDFLTDEEVVARYNHYAQKMSES